MNSVFAATQQRNDFSVDGQTTIVDAHRWLIDQNRYEFVAGAVDETPGIKLKTRMISNDLQGRTLLCAAFNLMLRNADGLPDFQDDKLRIVHAVEPDNGDVQVGALITATQGYVNSETLRRQVRNVYAQVWEDKQDVVRPPIGTNAYRVIRTVLAHLPPGFDAIDDAALIEHHLSNALSVLSEEVETNQMRIALDACLDGTASSTPLHLSGKMRDLFKTARKILGRHAAADQAEQEDMGPVSKERKVLPETFSTQVLRLSPKTGPLQLRSVKTEITALPVDDEGEPETSTVVDHIKRRSQERAEKKAQRRQKGYSMELPALHNDDEAFAIAVDDKKSAPGKQASPKAQDDSALLPAKHRRSKKKTARTKTGENLPKPIHDTNRKNAKLEFGQAPQNGEDATLGKVRHSKKCGRLHKLFPKPHASKKTAEASVQAPRKLTHLDMLARVPDKIRITLATEHWKLIETLFREMTTIENTNRILFKKDSAIDETLLQSGLIENVISDALQIFEPPLVAELDHAISALLQRLPDISVVNVDEQEEIGELETKSREEKNVASLFIGLHSTLVLIQSAIAKQASKSEEKYSGHGDLVSEGESSGPN